MSVSWYTTFAGNDYRENGKRAWSSYCELSYPANYGTPEYVDYFYRQLYELLTNYGPVFEIWFDGANGGDGWYGGAKDSRTIDRKTYYDYARAYEMIDKFQPQAVVFSDGGPGCRWVGNENGFAGATNWSFLRAGEVYPGYPNMVCRW